MKVAAMSLVLTIAAGIAGANAASVILADEWKSYLQGFVTEDGRVVDTANNGISHSESQGYGLVLSVLADDRATFERVWSFTKTELMVRDDGLAGWRWDPAASPNLTDANNATDGDILIAYGLALAGDAWSETSFTDRAREIATTIGSSMLVEAHGMTAILPGAAGFNDRADGVGPVLNPSYWVFEALTAFAKLDPSIDWNAVSETGIELVRRARLSKTGLPPDWLVLNDDGTVRPAPDFPIEFGYNGIRIPLYMMRAGINPVLLEPFRQNSDAEGLYKIDPLTGERLEPISEPGYRLIVAAMDCISNGTVVPEELRTLSPTSYYAATLQLLTLDYLRRSQPSCMTQAAS